MSKQETIDHLEAYVMSSNNETLMQFWAWDQMVQKQTAFYAGPTREYAFYGLVDEAAEAVEALKNFRTPISLETRMEFASELLDVLWYARELMDHSPDADKQIALLVGLRMDEEYASSIGYAGRTIGNINEFIAAIAKSRKNDLRKNTVLTQQSNEQAMLVNIVTEVLGYLANAWLVKLNTPFKQHADKLLQRNKQGGKK